MNKEKEGRTDSHYGHLPPITKTIQVRRTRHAGHCWRSIIGEHLGEDASNGVTASIGIEDEGCGVRRKIRKRQDGCTGESRVEVVEGIITFLGPLEFAAFLCQSG